MPSMSAVERSFCRSAAWRTFTRGVVLPWALQGVTLHGDLLELGSGTGAMAEGTSQVFPDLRLTVTDIDPAMVVAARRRLGQIAHISVKEADVTGLPFAAASFDFVATYLMLHHVIDWPKAISEAARVLRPGGTLLGYDLTDTRLAEWIHVADRSPHRLLEPHELEPAFSRAGLDDINVHQSFGGHVVRFLAHKPGA